MPDTEPKWQFLAAWLPPSTYLSRCGTELPTPSVPMREMLCCQGSLTRELEAHFGQPVTVQLDSQEWVSPETADTLPSTYDPDGPPVWDQQLSLPQSAPVLIRNAWLIVAGRHCFFAHSQVTAHDLPAPLQHAIEQGITPLGALFSSWNTPPQPERIDRPELTLTVIRRPGLAVRCGLPPDHLFPSRRSLLRVDGILRARILEMLVAVW